MKIQPWNIHSAKGKSPLQTTKVDTNRKWTEQGEYLWDYSARGISCTLHCTEMRMWCRPITFEVFLLKSINFPFFYRTRLRFEFRASNPNGILFYTGTSDFIECHLEEGRVSCSFTAGGGILTLTSPQDSYSDGKWHSVSSILLYLQYRCSTYCCYLPSRSLKGSFSGNSVKISNCRAFSPFKTLPGCRAFRHSIFLIGHFRVLLCLCFKASLSAKPFMQKMSSAGIFILMQIKVTFIRMV